MSNKSSIASSPSYSNFQQRKSGATFIQKLSLMLNDTKNSQYINWSEDGMSFIIFDLDNFVQNILPLYFKHDKFQSFVRQLNMYGFHKKNRLPRRKNQIYNKNLQFYQFSHPYFIRNREDLLGRVKRVINSNHQEDALAYYSYSDQEVNGVHFINNNDILSLKSLIFKLQHEVDYLKEEAKKSQLEQINQNNLIQKLLFYYNSHNNNNTTTNQPSTSSHHNWFNQNSSLLNNDTPNVLNTNTNNYYENVNSFSTHFVDTLNSPPLNKNNEPDTENLNDHQDMSVLGSVKNEDSNPNVDNYWNNVYY